VTFYEVVKLASPEQLDETLQILPRRNRAAWWTCFGLLLFGLIWGALGYIPEVGRGHGILVTPSSVVTLQARASGQVARWFVEEGDHIEKGQVIGLLEQSLIEQELKHSLGKLAEVEERNRVMGGLRKKYSGQARKAIARKRQNLRSRIAYLEGYIQKTKAVSESLQKANVALIQEQRKSFAESRANALSIHQAMEGRLESYNRLRKEKLISEESLQTARNNRDEALIKLSELKLNMEELNLKEVQLKEAYLNTQEMITTRENDLTSLRLQLRELDNTEAQLNKIDSELKFQWDNELNEVRRSVIRAQLQLGLNREVKSEYSGRLLELTAAAGNYVNEGQRIALIDTRQSDVRPCLMANLTRPAISDRFSFCITRYR